MIAMHPALARVVEALTAADAGWMLLRGEDDLLHPAGDVDLLVDSAFLPSVDAVLAAAGFRRVRAAGHGSHRFFFLYEDGQWVKLDVVSEIDFGPFQQWRTPLAAQCLARRVRVGPLWLPGIEDRAWLVLLHLLLDKGSVAGSRRASARTASAIAAHDDDVAAFVDQHLGKGTSALVLDLVRNEDWNGLDALAGRLGHTWSAAQPLSWLRAAAHRVLRLSGARLDGGGMLLGVVAPDGAGKTTLLRRLTSDVPLPTRYVYMGLWGAGRWDSVLSWVPGGRLAKKVVRTVRSSAAARVHRALGRIVLLDRLAYDTVLTAGSAAGRIERITNAFALRIMPEPEVVLILDVPGDTMFARKGEHTPELLEQWRRDYLALARRVPNAQVVDASQSPDVVSARATQLMWRSLSPERPPGPPAGDSDLPLHRWRLLDWRFLLPTMAHGRVGYGGDVGAPMVEALHLLDPAALAIRPAGTTGLAASLDVVLLVDPDRRLARAAAAALRQGGWICVMAHRSLLAPRRGPRTLAGWRRELARLGFDDVGVYWHVPTLENTARMVPADSPRAIRGTLDLHRGVHLGLIKAVAGRAALALRAFTIAAPAGTVTAHHGGGVGGRAHR